MPSRPQARSRSARTSCVRLVGLALEAVADATQRLDVCAGFAELLAQALDVGIDGARCDIGIDAPDIAEQGIARLHAAAPRQECIEQAELERGEADLDLFYP